MTDASNMMKLYSKRILELAADIPYSERLEDPQASEMKRSPLCGSTVTVDVAMEDGKISAFGQDVKACALGQASASVLGNVVIGLTLADLCKGREQLTKMLKSDGLIPEAPFEALEVLQPAKAFKNRHASILLAFDATIAAVESLSVSNT